MKTIIKKVLIITLSFLILLNFNTTEVFAANTNNCITMNMNSNEKKVYNKLDKYYKNLNKKTKNKKLKKSELDYRDNEFNIILDKDNINKYFMDYFWLNHPECYYIDIPDDEGSWNSSNKIYNVFIWHQPEFSNNPSMYYKYYKRYQNKVKKVKKEIDNNIERYINSDLYNDLYQADPEETIKYIITNLLLEYCEDNIKYSNKSDYDYGILNILNGKNTAVCEGYAEFYKLMCDEYGIECICTFSNDHVWNKIKIYGEWINVDPQSTYGLSDKEFNKIKKHKERPTKLSPKSTRNIDEITEDILNSNADNND